MSIEKILFFVVIFLANIIQGITGFAGTVLAMPFSINLVGYQVAKPVLNVLGLLSGIYVFVGNWKNVKWRELLKIVLIMTGGIIVGIIIKGAFEGKEQLLYKGLGIFIILMATSGLAKMKKPAESQRDTTILLPIAGIVHGIFVSGGPLLISYLTTKIKDKLTFRATISTVWIFLNSMILIDDIRNGYWTMSLLKTQLIAIPFLFGGMFIGGCLVKRMSQEKFMKLTYILLVISGMSLLVK